jgi:hypothetical protein
MTVTDFCTNCRWRGAGCGQCPHGPEKPAQTSAKASNMTQKSKQVSVQGGQVRKGLKRPKQPNKTEAEYGLILKAEFPNAYGLTLKAEFANWMAPMIVFEGLTMSLKSGHKYTPDWVVKLANGDILCVEVKNSAYKHASYGRSRLAFDCARTEWPFLFRWVEKTKEGWIELFCKTA